MQVSRAKTRLGAVGGRKTILTHVVRWDSVMFSAAIITAASISVRCIGFPKMMSNGSCGKDCK